jgi:hypothetical protein
MLVLSGTGGGIRSAGPRPPLFGGHFVPKSERSERRKAAQGAAPKLGR